MSDKIAVNPSDIREKVVNRLQESVEELIPWFYSDMPEYYFRTHGEDEQIKHVMALLSGMVRDEKQTIEIGRASCRERVLRLV